ncbi:MAG TPA: signal peptidase I [Nocardioidaceae bacterium]|nr:signal peptidase I [Nocardioidaceae bacterium]
MTVTRQHRDEKVRRRSIPVWLETILLLVLALVVSAIIKTFFVQMFFVPSGSMEPLLEGGPTVKNDRILVEKWSYWTQPVHRGDVVVFKDPGGRWLGAEGVQDLTPLQQALATIGLFPTGGHLVKRVIGVGGDEVRCCDAQGRITVNGVPLHENSYIIGGAKPSEERFDVHVPAGRLWVMGDNRSNSEDSRFHQSLPGGGTVPVDDVVGKVWAIVWPFDRAKFLHDPATFDNPQLAPSH